MSLILPKENCTGCTSCAEICPKSCITMKQNDFGFMYPNVDESRCIECGLCEKTCPILHSPQNTSIPSRAFAAYCSDDDIRLVSSSGGMFSLLARLVLVEGGIVFGAAFDEKFYVHHIGVETEKDLYKFRGSKYVQSDLENTFREVKEALDNGRKVLFSGVICQIAGLKSYLKQDYSNLITVDVLCHGVPSPKLWDRYLKWQEETHNSQIVHYQFRNKKFGWESYSVVIDFEDGERSENNFSKDPFMQMFLGNISLRPSCFDCQFNAVDRLSDITIGDCWSINRVFPEMNDDKGISVVLIHSYKGLNCFKSISPEIVFKEAKVDTILPLKSGGRMSVRKHSKYNVFFDKLEDWSIPRLAKLSKASMAKRIYWRLRRDIGKFLWLCGIKRS